MSNTEPGDYPRSVERYELVRGFARPLAIAPVQLRNRVFGVQGKAKKSNASSGEVVKNVIRFLVL